MASKPPLEAIALLGEFGFEFVAADQVGEPTAGRIADRLSEIIGALEDALARGNLAAVQQATEKLKRLQRAIDVWSLLASEPEIPEAASQKLDPVPRTRPPAPPPPSRRPDAPIDVERLEMAAAGTQQGFLQVIGENAPPRRGNDD